MLPESNKQTSIWYKGGVCTRRDGWQASVIHFNHLLSEHSLTMDLSSSPGQDLLSNTAVSESDSARDSLTGQTDRRMEICCYSNGHD